MLGLLGFESGLQTQVVEKITSFLSRIVHGIIFYLKCQGMTKELEAMWCSPIGPINKPPLNHVLHFHISGVLLENVEL
jgi:hypothetical protein